MKLEKAIEILKQQSIKASNEGLVELVNAYELAVEALKLIAQEPPEGYTCIPRPLPGETEE